MGASSEFGFNEAICKIEFKLFWRDFFCWLKPSTCLRLFESSFLVASRFCCASCNFRLVSWDALTESAGEETKNRLPTVKKTRQILHKRWEYCFFSRCCMKKGLRGRWSARLTSWCIRQVPTVWVRFFFRFWHTDDIWPPPHRTCAWLPDSSVCRRICRFRKSRYGSLPE